MGYVAADINVASFNAANDPVTFAFDAGSSVGRVLTIAVLYNASFGHTLGAVSYNGVAATAAGALVSQGNLRGRLYTVVNPASGSNTVSVASASGAGTAPVRIGVHVEDGADVGGTPTEGYNSASASNTTPNMTSALALSSATGKRVVTFHGVLQSGTSLTGGTATGFTERDDDGNGNVRMVVGDADGAGTVNTSTAWVVDTFTGINWIALGLTINPAAPAGPTITTQPADQTVLLSYGNTANVSVAATGEGDLEYDWEFDGDPVGTDSPSLAIPGLTIADDGKQGRVTVTDDNGFTESNLFTITVVAGDALSTLSGTLDGDGEAVTQFTSDAPVVDGEFVKLRGTSGSRVERMAVRPVTPP